MAAINKAYIEEFMNSNEKKEKNFQCLFVMVSLGGYIFFALPAEFAHNSANRNSNTYTRSMDKCEKRTELSNTEEKGFHIFSIHFICWPISFFTLLLMAGAGGAGGGE